MDRGRSKDRIRPSKKNISNGENQKMKPTVPDTGGIDFCLYEQGQDSIVEKLSVSVPVAPLPKLSKPFWVRFVGSRVLLQLRDGAQIVGILKEILWDYIRLEAVTEVGRNYRVSAAWAVIDSSIVARIYPADADIEHNG